jgi:hypothetical protein
MELTFYTQCRLIPTHSLLPCQVEAAIDEYFSQNLIVPSPWVGHSGARHQSRLAELMEHNASPVVGGAGNRATAGTSPFDNDPPPRPENNESAGSAMNMTNLRSNKVSSKIRGMAEWIVIRGAVKGS